MSRVASQAPVVVGAPGGTVGVGARGLAGEAGVTRPRCRCRGPLEQGAPVHSAGRIAPSPETDIAGPGPHDQPRIGPRFGSRMKLRFVPGGSRTDRCV